VAAEKLQRLGVDVIYTGNAKHYDYRYSNIIHPQKAGPATIRASRMLGELCGIPSGLVRPSRQAAYATLVLGHDYRTILARLDRCLGGSPSSSTRPETQP
jgi:hypothetical protein